mmetsp:Transcript_647/g.923  ORF Transcript_647/g.923 Transcript_647/m.923 type:complete len:214 (-) Transcript_647:1918-2559(-)
MDLESFRMVSSVFFKFIEKHDILSRRVAVDEEYLRGVVVVLQDGHYELVTRGDASSSSDEADFVGLVGLLVDQIVPVSAVRDVTDWPLGLDAVPDLHGVEVLRQQASQGELLAFAVDLDEKAEESHFVVSGDRRVSSHNQLAVDPGADQQVSTHWQSENMQGTLEGKLELNHIVRQNLLCHQLERQALLGVEGDGSAVGVGAAGRDGRGSSVR